MLKNINNIFYKVNKKILCYSVSKQWSLHFIVINLFLKSLKFITVLSITLFMMSCAEIRSMPDINNDLVNDEKVLLNLGTIEVINNDTTEEKGIKISTKLIKSKSYEKLDGSDIEMNLYPREIMINQLEKTLRSNQSSEGKMTIVIDKMRIERKQNTNYHERYDIYGEVTVFIEKSDYTKTIKVESNSFREFSGQHEIIEIKNDLYKATNQVINDINQKIIENIQDFYI